MRVLCVQKATGIGGSERHLLSLLPGLAARGVDVRMCVLTAGDADRFITALSAVGIATSRLPAGPDLNPVLHARLVAEIRRFRPDLVHTHLIHGDLHGLPAAGLAGVRSVSTLHGAPAFYRREPYRSVGRASGRLAAARIAISHHVAGVARELGLAPPERLHVVHYGIGTAPWRRDPEGVAAARKQFGLADREVAVGLASRLIPGKGHQALLDAMDLTASDAPNVRLLIAGTGPLREPLEKDARARGHAQSGAVRFLGFVTDMPAFMNACDVLAFPSSPEIGEGFGLAVLEAMAAGRPVIATAAGPVPEIVVDGETGILLPPGPPGVDAGAPPAWADAILRLAADPEERRRLGESAARRADDVFPLDAMVDRTLAVYESVTTGPKR